MLNVNSEILFMLEECSSVQESESKLPQQICKSCNNQLKKSYDFRQKCCASLELLNEILETSKNGIKKEEPETLTDNYDMHLEIEIKSEDNQTADDNDSQNLLHSPDPDIKEEDSDNNSTDNVSEIEKTEKTKNKIRKSKKKTATSEENFDYICDLCGRTFKKRSHLKVHQKTHIGPKNNEPDRRELCYLCGKFIIPKCLSYHLSTHKKLQEKYTCKICGRNYATKNILQKHVKKKHTDAVNIRFYCDICNKDYVSRGSLKIHKSFVHSEQRNEKKHCCPLCDKKYKLTSHMKAHINAAHKDLRPHACTICSKAFHTRTLLKKHMRYHTGERPFVCTICGKGFPTKYGLTTHMKVHSK
ncbi:zinc finger protein 26-like [Chrysoperla carnea]|uniref:zinc finger protein 26-like n=1 Tax=Chrysoperla carnea TaxID=189513 RepID=UPI001D06D8BA|nr:zinc finger protein 26-like [Chrysoperla carnea]